jgi:transcriptional regulator with XRE-family HTH domain
MAMERHQILGERLHTLRRRKGWTLRELERQSRVSYVSISKVESGNSPQVSAETVARLADALEVSVDYLLGRTETLQAQGERDQARAHEAHNAADQAHERISKAKRPTKRRRTPAKVAES